MSREDLQVTELLKEYLDTNFSIADFDEKVAMEIYRNTDFGRSTYLANQNSERLRATPHFLAGIYAAANLKRFPHCAKSVVNDCDILSYASEGSITISKATYSELLANREELRSIQAEKLLSIKLKE